jgi:hypothetical protein
MKKILVATLGAILIAVPLSACSSETVAEPAPKETVYVPQPAPEPQTNSDEDSYLTAVRSKDSALYSVPDASLVELAGTICQSLRSGIPVQRVIQTGLDSGLSTNQVAALVAGAVVFYCPDQESEVRSL